MSNIFEEATRKKLRFETKLGVLTTEDLWDLDLDQLDAIHIKLSRETITAKESLLKTHEVDPIVDLKVKIVSEIFKVKQEEIETRKVDAYRKAKINKINDIIAMKEDAELSAMSVEELKALKETI